MSSLDELRQSFANLPGTARVALRAELQAAMQDLVNIVQGDKLSGQVLQVRSGRLRASITAMVSDDGETLTGTVGSEGVLYAAIQEYGGTIARRQATSARRLRHQAAGKGEIVEPERSYLRSALAEQSDSIRGRLTQAVLTALQKGIGS